MAAQMVLDWSSSASALSSSATPSSSCPMRASAQPRIACAMPKNCGMDDLFLERESPLRFEQRCLYVAVDLQSPWQLRQRLGEGRRVVEGLAERDGLAHLGHCPHRLASQGEGKSLEREGANAGIVVAEEEGERVMRFGTVDGPAVVGRRDGVVDPSCEQRVHPAGVEGLKPHRIVALGGGQRRQSVDEARRKSRSRRDGRGRWRGRRGPGTARRWGCLPSSAPWRACRLARPRVRPTRAARRARLPAAAAAWPPYGCARPLRGAAPRGRSRGISTRPPAGSPTA